jgi:4-azaleucine resistance transporter AzlC
MSFTVLARDSGFSVSQVIVTAMLCFAGAAQFAALTVLSAGGTAVAAIIAGTLMNGRYLAMGIAVAPSLPGGAGRRAIQGQAVVDSSWALANRGDGTFDRWLLFGTTLPQYIAWVLGASAGAWGGDVLGDADRLGLDSVLPTFVVCILMAELRNRRAMLAAVCGAIIAVALVPLTPPGVPVMAASLAALTGLRR